MQATSSRSFLGLPQLHTPSATSRTLSHASVHHFLPCIRYVWFSVLPGLLLLVMTLGPSLIHSQCPSPSPHSVLSIQQVLRKGLLKSVLHLPRRITHPLSIIIVFLNFSIFPLWAAPTPNRVIQASPRRKSCHQPTTQNCGGGEGRLCLFHLLQEAGQSVPEATGAEREQCRSMPHSRIPPTATLLKASETQPTL